MTRDKLRVGVLGAGRWATGAHIPGWVRDPRCEVAVVCDVERDRAQAAAAEFGIKEATNDWQAVVARADLDVIDVATPSATHQELSLAALEGGKHVLCEKPVAFDFRQTWQAAELAKRKGLLTKLGFTFRYSPGVKYARSLIEEGYVGRPFVFNGYEQNSQWLDPQNPLRQVDPNADPNVLHVSSLEGYGAPIIDIGMWWVGAPYARTVGMLKNFIPERVVRATGRLQRMNIDDADIHLVEYENGALGSIQTSYITIGNYPGIEARLYGERGAIICRLVEEFGVAETIKLATPDGVEFKQVEVPQRFYPAGGHPRESWRTLFYANLIRDFLDEMTGAAKKNEGNFEDGARVQEVINAVEASYRERRWVDLPLPR
jgi:predicted dehydrogenase